MKELRKTEQDFITDFATDLRKLDFVLLLYSEFQGEKSLYPNQPLPAESASTHVLLYSCSGAGSGGTNACTAGALPLNHFPAFPDASIS